MKNLIKDLLQWLMVVSLLLTGCAKNDPVDKPALNDSNNNQFKTELIYCGTPVVSPMVDFAQTTSPASVTIGNSEDSLLIKYELFDADWYIYNAALFAGTLDELTALWPETVVNPDGSGVFNPGVLPNQSYHSATANVHLREYLFNLNNLPSCMVVVAYMQIRNDAGDRVFLWGKSATKSSGFYMNYCVQPCTPPPPPPPPLGGCETGYAFGETYANCFLGIPGVQSNNWGWSNGPIGAGNYSWPIYAGAGQCNISNGIHVGTLTVNYSPPTANVTYTVFTGYVLNATHLYIGNQILPKKNGKFTTAPGQFPYKHDNLNGVTTDSYTVSGLSGNIYVAAHSEVCDDL